MASTLKHDSAGFLVGELLDVNRELLAGQNAGMAVWRGIHSDVKAIARALGVQARTARSQQRSSSAGGTSNGRESATTGPARDADGRYVRRVATPAGRSGSRAPEAGSAGRGTGGAQQRTSAAETARGESRTTVTPAGRSQRTRTAGPGAGAATPDDISATRDGLGRFTGGSRGGGTSDKAERDDKALLAKSIAKLGVSLDGADGLDPTIAAMKEVKDAVSPLGRGMFSMFGRNAERKKEVWYKRLLKAITGKKDSSAPGAGMGGGEAVQSGSFMGTLMGELAPKVMLFIMPILTAIGGVLLGGLALLGGVKLGEFIYKWLTDSGLMAKIFDAVDAAKKVILNAADWGKKKYEAAKVAVTTAASDFQKGSAEKTDPVKYAPAVLDASGRNVNDPRRTDRAAAVTSDGRAINDPRRLDAASPAELPPATSMAQRAGRVVGSIKNLLKPGSKVIDERKAVLTTQMDAAGITDPVERAAFMAQADHESGGFKHMQELGGSSYFKQYDGRKDIGNTQPGDGERFKGRGFFQLTGRANYRSMGKKLGLDLENQPEQAANPEIAAKIATQFWADRSRARKFGGGKLSELARAGNIDGVTQGINGGMNGAQSRRDLFASYLKSGETGAVGTAGVGRIPPLAINSSGGATVSAGAARMPPVVIPSSVPERIAPAPDAAIPTQLNTAKQAPIKVSMREAIGQDVGDRGIAHVVSGGLGQIA